MVVIGKVCIATVEPMCPQLSFTNVVEKMMKVVVLFLFSIVAWELLQERNHITDI